MRLYCIFQGIALLDLNLDLTRTDFIEQIGSHRLKQAAIENIGAHGGSGDLERALAREDAKIK